MITIKQGSIETDGMRLENWGHVNWLINALTQNAELLWGKDVPKKPSATILSLVKDGGQTTEPQKS